jgi:hypothetical protein
MIKPIETQYKGYRFRSRLEARWAVFFDALELNWAYEPEGYDLGEHGYYLPDFWFDFGTPNQFWFEVKPHSNLSEREVNVAVALAEHAPGFIMLGHITPPKYTNAPAYYGSWAISFGMWANLPPSLPAPIDPRMYCWHERAGGSFLLWPVPAREINLMTPEQASRFSETAGEDEHGFPVVRGEFVELLGGEQLNPLGKTKWIDSPRLLAAYDAARAARFEHGETPAHRR